MRIGPNGCSKTAVRDFRYWLSNNPEERIISNFSGRDKGHQQSIRVSGNSRRFKIFVPLATLLYYAWAPADQRLYLKSV